MDLTCNTPRAGGDVKEVPAMRSLRQLDVDVEVEAVCASGLRQIHIPAIIESPCS
jgi:hypothetical protein